MAKKANPYLYAHEAKGQTRYGYRREYKGKQLRARGFVTPGKLNNTLIRRSRMWTPYFVARFAASLPPHKKLSISTDADLTS